MGGIRRDYTFLVIICGGLETKSTMTALEEEESQTKEKDYGSTTFVYKKKKLLEK